MKVKRFESIAEKVQNIKPKMGQYIFDTYLSNFIKTIPKITDTPPSEYDIYFEYLKSYYKIEYSYKNKSSHFDKDNFDHFSNMINAVESLCTDVKNTKGVYFRFYENHIMFYLIISMSKINEIKESDSFKEWYEKTDLEYLKYKEDQVFKKDLKKYNL